MNKYLSKVVNYFDLNKRASPDYEQAYNILMDYWDYIPEEEKMTVHLKLRKCGL